MKSGSRTPPLSAAIRRPAPSPEVAISNEHVLTQRPLFGMTCMCVLVRPPNRRQIGLICAQPSGEITNGAAEQNGGFLPASGPGATVMGPR
jgi:hypothetical protein